MFKKKFPSLSSLGSDGNTAFLRAARAGHLDKVLDHLKSNIDINTSNTNGLNALHLASKDGHVNVVTELLKRGAVVDSATKKGNTALHIASLAGQEEVVKLLVATGASVNVQSQNGFTPLYMAAQENHDNVVKFLLANGANQSLATEDGFTPLAVAMQQGHDKVVAVLLENDTRGKVRLPALHIAAKKDDCKAAALLLQNDHNPDVTSKSGFTPLHIAAHYGNEGIANLLLNRGADVNYSAKHNISPLHVAAKWGKTNLVSLLLEKGATIESKTRDGLTPLHCAARSGHEQVVDMMLEREAPISSKTKNGLAPLHMAAQGDHVDAARILLYHRAPVDEVTVDYLTALHVAAHCGHVRVAKLLLDRKADPNARALNGFTPLHIACKKNRIKVVELLLKHGGSIEATTESGLTPLHVASFMGCMNIVIFLLQNDASPDVPTVRGETPLHLAARANQTDIIRILLRNGAQVDARAREQQTPLHIASRLGNVDIVMLLLQHGAAVDSTTKDMYTALHIAAKEGQEEVASVLLEHGASLTATTKKGFTPLHLAAKYGNIKVAKLLLQKEAPVDAQGKNGVTPLHVASHYDHQNVALLLLDKGASPHATAKNGHTPLHIAARKNQMDIATTLLEYGAKANAESKAGFTPLHLSSQEGHTDMSTLLIEHQADTNHKAKNGLTPLHLCAQEDRVNVAAILVKNGALVDSTTKAGYTPLHVASHFGQVNMIRFLLDNNGDVAAATSVGYTPLHQAAQQGHTTIVNLLLENKAPPNTQTNQGQTALNIAQKLGYISVVETLKGVTEPSGGVNGAAVDEKYKVVAPETMQETFMSDSEDEGGEDTMLSDQPYRYLTVDEMKSLGDDSLPIDVTRDERMDSNRECMAPPQAVDDTISPQHVKESYSQFAANYTTQADNIDIARHPVNVGFLVSFLVDARGGAMRGCRHSGVRVIVPPRKAAQPMRVTCRYLKRDKLSHPPPLMEGEALASRILELGPVGGKFLGPVIIEVPHFGSLRGMEREIVILRSDNGETWREHTLEASDDAIHDVLNESFEADEISALEEPTSGRTTRILTTDFPQYFAVVSRIRQEVHAIGPEGGMVSSSVVPQVQAVFPQGALTKKIKVGLQAQPIAAELAAKLLGNRVAVSPIVTVEPRRRKFHKPITLTIPVPQAANKGMINQYSGDAPTLRLLCSITGGTTRAQWEDVTGSTPLTFVNDCVSFTTTVSARFWLMDCRNIADATKMATELYREAIHVPFMAKFVVFAKRTDLLEARLRVFCMTDDKEDKTLEHQEHFTEVAKSRDVEVLEGKPQYVEFAGNLVPVTKSGDQLQLGFRAFRENRLPFTVRVKDPHADTVGRVLFMREGRVAKGEPPQQPICILNIVLPGDIVPEPVVVEADLQSLNKKYSFLRDGGLGRLESYQRTDLRLSDISNLIGDDWVALASELDVTTSEVNDIKSECPASAAQQAMAMLRLWLQQAGNKGNGNTLETALRKIGRDDIVEQCIFNVDERTVSRVRTEQLKDSAPRDRDIALRRNISLDAAYNDEQDIMKESESVEELVQAERIIPGDRRQYSDEGESKYVGEEKVVVEEQKSVSALKEIFAQDKRDRQYERQPSVGELEPKSRPASIVEKVTSSVRRTSSTSDERPTSEVETVEETVEREIPESERFTVEEIRQKFSASQPESITTVTKVTKKTSGIPVTTKTAVVEVVAPGTPEVVKKTTVTEVVKTPEATKKTTEVTTTIIKEISTPEAVKKVTGIPSLTQKDSVKELKSKTETTTETVTTKISGLPTKTEETITKTVTELPKTTVTVVDGSPQSSEFVSKTTSEVTVTTKTSGIPVVTKTTKVTEMTSRSGDQVTDVTSIEGFKASADQRRDSELFQGVSEELGRLETTFKVVPVEDGILSPKVSKTPPPSPAEFNRDQTAAPSTWSSGGTLSTERQPSTQEWSDKSLSKDGAQALDTVDTELFRWNTGSNRDRESTIARPDCSSPFLLGETFTSSEPTNVDTSGIPSERVTALRRILDDLYVDMSLASREHSSERDVSGSDAYGGEEEEDSKEVPSNRLQGQKEPMSPSIKSSKANGSDEVEHPTEFLKMTVKGNVKSDIDNDYVEVLAQQVYENTSNLDVDLSDTVQKQVNEGETEVNKIKAKKEAVDVVFIGTKVIELLPYSEKEKEDPNLVKPMLEISKHTEVQEVKGSEDEQAVHHSLQLKQIPGVKPPISPKPKLASSSTVTPKKDAPANESGKKEAAVEKPKKGFFASLLNKKPAEISGGGAEVLSQGSAQLEQLEATVDRILTEVELQESILTKPEEFVEMSPKNKIQGPELGFDYSEVKTLPEKHVNTWEAAPDNTTVIELLPKSKSKTKPSNGVVTSFKSEQNLLIGVAVDNLPDDHGDVKDLISSELQVDQEVLEEDLVKEVDEMLSNDEEVNALINKEQMTDNVGEIKIVDVEVKDTLIGRGIIPLNEKEMEQLIDSGTKLCGIQTHEDTCDTDAQIVELPSVVNKVEEVIVSVGLPDNLTARLEHRKKLKQALNEELNYETVGTLPVCSTKPEEDVSQVDSDLAENTFENLETSVNKLLTDIKDDELGLFLFDPEELGSVPSRESSQTTDLGDHVRFSSEESDDMWWQTARRDGKIPLPGSQAEYWESVRLNNLGQKGQKEHDKHVDARVSMMSYSSNENALRRTSTGDEGDTSSIEDDDRRSLTPIPHSVDDRNVIINDPMTSSIFPEHDMWESMEKEGKMTNDMLNAWASCLPGQLSSKFEEKVYDDGNISRILANFPSSTMSPISKSNVEVDDGNISNILANFNSSTTPVIPHTSTEVIDSKYLDSPWDDLPKPKEKFDDGNISRILANFPSSSASHMVEGEPNPFDPKLSQVFGKNQSHTLPRTWKVSQEYTSDQPISKLFVRTPGYEQMKTYNRTPSTKSLDPSKSTSTPIKPSTSSSILPVLKHLKRESSYDRENETPPPDADTSSSSSSPCSSPDYFAAPPLRFPSLQQITQTPAVPLTGPPIVSSPTNRSYITTPTSSLPTTPKLVRRAPDSRSSTGSHSPSPGYNIASSNLQNLPQAGSISSLTKSPVPASTFFTSNPFTLHTQEYLTSFPIASSTSTIDSSSPSSPTSSHKASNPWNIQPDMRPSPTIPFGGYCNWSSQSDSRESTPRGGDSTSEWAPREASSSVTTTTTTTTRGAGGLVSEGAAGAEGGVTVTTTETRVVEGSEDMQDLLAKLAAEQRK